jgi:hypothetical protein
MALRTRLLFCLLVGLALPASSASSAYAQQAAPPHEGQHRSHGAPSLPALCACPTEREASGTSWQPDATAAHSRLRNIGDWQVLTHAQLAAVGAREDGPRGDDAFFSTNYLMIAGRRRAGRGVLGIQSMWSLEPAMGRRGYPLLLQTGETSDGVTPLIDRQHPHDFPMELAVTYSRSLRHDRGIYLYAAAVGAPALGPPAFMHRASASGLPTSPITHHWFDSTHVSFGVLTFGFIVSPRAKFEVSGFRGREPDQHRWGFERPGLDSAAVRLSINPTPHVAAQVSVGQISDAEQIHPGADVTRLTASAMYSRQWTRIAIDALAAWGHNKRSPSSFPVPGGIYYMPGAVADAALLEATVRVFSRHAIIGRFEYASKDELFPLDDPRHPTLYGVTRVTSGYAIDVLRLPELSVGVGAAVSWNRVDGVIADAYGGSPRALLGFVVLKTH